MTIKELKKGAMFTLKNIENPNESQVYIKGDYDRATKTYSCICFADTCKEKFLKASKEVFTEFTF